MLDNDRSRGAASRASGGEILVKEQVWGTSVGGQVYGRTSMGEDKCGGKCGGRVGGWSRGKLVSMWRCKGKGGVEEASVEERGKGERRWLGV